MTCFFNQQDRLPFLVANTSSCHSIPVQILDNGQLRLWEITTAVPTVMNECWYTNNFVKHFGSVSIKLIWIMNPLNKPTTFTCWKAAISIVYQKSSGWFQWNISGICDQDKAENSWSGRISEALYVAFLQSQTPTHCFWTVGNTRPCSRSWPAAKFSFPTIYSCHLK